MWPRGYANDGTDENLSTDRKGPSWKSTEAAEAMKFLVVSADDFGWSRDVNEGILESHLSGVVTAAGLLANAPDFTDAVARAFDTPSLDIGIHLNIYRFRPVLRSLRGSRLTSSGGSFREDVRQILRYVLSSPTGRRLALEEFRAQIERVLELGLPISHLDSDKHLHLWPTFFPSVAELAVEYRIRFVRTIREEAVLPLSLPAFLSLLSLPARARLRRLGRATPDHTRGITTPPRTLATLKNILSKLPAGLTELISHPGRIDSRFHQIQKTVRNRLVEERKQELDTLATTQARNLLHDFRIALTSFRDYNTCGIP
ncbi:MAG: ChbG/HpnK family deacetylase [Candidatus Hydrogenedentota bacterium]|nr:MAG: ChbG/HpnK family deacetylase [Candidatus Hydrogenedentota bacterium]